MSRATGIPAQPVEPDLDPPDSDDAADRARAREARRWLAHEDAHADESRYERARNESPVRACLSAGLREALGLDG